MTLQEQTTTMYSYNVDTASSPVASVGRASGFTSGSHTRLLDHPLQVTSSMVTFAVIVAAHSVDGRCDPRISYVEQ